VSVAGLRRTNSTTARLSERFARPTEQATRLNMTCMSATQSNSPGRYHCRRHHRPSWTAASHRYLFRYRLHRRRCHRGFQAFPAHPSPLSGRDP